MRHKKALGMLLAVSLLGSVAAVAAEAGSAGDPLISISWIKDVFTPQALDTAQKKIDTKTDALYQKVSALPTTGTVELRVKRGDLIKLETGSGITSFAGNISVMSSGPIVDVTTGTEFVSQFVLEPSHHYLMAENSSASFAVNTDTAVVRLNGAYQLESSSAVDYNAAADALKDMGLFKGTDSGYGSGYDLEKSPSRIQGLIMFLRLLGEEQAALQYKGNVTFSDVPEWALPYVSYAYDHGYTNGMGYDDQWRVVFGPELPLQSRDYVTFLLRALGYIEPVDFSWLTSIDDAVQMNVLTAGEGALLNSDTPFLRAQVAYLSYIALYADYPGQNMTLFEHLRSMGTVSNMVEAGLSRL